MNIGQAAQLSGISIKMIRYYEQIALIPPASRNEAGYRQYSERDVHRLRFIRRARELGFSMEHITALLDLWQDRSRQNAQVRHVATEHIQELRARIAKLETMVTTLHNLVEDCANQDRPDCPILAELDQKKTTPS